ncbi:hypothetical protein [Nocardia sp. NPDC057440]|uniref:hypothetical protein n=1 Tax=Nocardia sp. NPDC057440 TaxID=3346134 RepID=UPI00366C7E00
MKGGLIRFFKENEQKITSGKIKGVEIGAAYGIGWTAVLTVVPPLGALEGLTRAIFGVGLGDLAVNIGKYYGSIVDEVAKLLENESVISVAETIGSDAQQTGRAV